MTIRNRILSVRQPHRGPSNFVLTYQTLFGSGEIEVPIGEHLYWNSERQVRPLDSNIPVDITAVVSALFCDPDVLEILYYGRDFEKLTGSEVDKRNIVIPDTFGGQRILWKPRLLR